MYFLLENGDVPMSMLVSNVFRGVLLISHQLCLPPKSGALIPATRLSWTTRNSLERLRGPEIHPLQGVVLSQKSLVDLPRYKLSESKLGWKGATNFDSKEIFSGWLANYIIKTSYHILLFETAYRYVCIHILLYTSLINVPNWMFDILYYLVGAQPPPNIATLCSSFSNENGHPGCGLGVPGLDLKLARKPPFWMVLKPCK